MQFVEYRLFVPHDFSQGLWCRDSGEGHEDTGGGRARFRSGYGQPGELAQALILAAAARPWDLAAGNGPPPARGRGRSRSAFASLRRAARPWRNARRQPLSGGLSGRLFIERRTWRSRTRRRAQKLGNAARIDGIHLHVHGRWLVIREKRAIYNYENLALSKSLRRRAAWVNAGSAGVLL